MNNDNKHIQKSTFFYGLIIFISLSTAFLLINGRNESFLFLNKYHNTALNYFFCQFTYFGDGITIILICILLFLLNKRLDFMLLLSTFLMSGLLVQILKKIFCAPRPISVFNHGEINIISGIYTAAKYSFPSGHTTTAFAAASLFVLLYNDKRLNLILLIAAILVGFSRIYLGQHFLEDVIFGALLGTVSSLVVYNAWKTIYKTGHSFSLR